ncbi:hypothetical protein ACM93F_001291 [Enterobacter ludwigii]|jgi:hypothetical protein|nr:MULTISPECIES: hypothetical protein [Enterobacter cloacae complex]AVP03108.1 hypothetical protein AM379_23050 [Enterobacter cloacae complex sp. FDA-CDC-AR_0132]AWC85832.1 hypothetical protein AM410_15940 [Enterobacter cloacae complex sp. FDA-CDC-AR_0164]EUM29439.1 hypothetical protein L462_02104 [Enterobacter sp. BIDMC 26]MBG0633378.1 hypothetical protein [Enterobacter ludwigii]MBQ0226080.1 hypothetical protein [Enterobacter ludwigii]
MSIKGNHMKLKDIIDIMVKSRCEDDNFCIYGSDGELFGEKEYFVSGYPQVDENDKEVYPQDAASRDLSYIYSGEQFADVILSVIEQKPSASNQDFIDALNYYLENDDFLDF